MTSFINWIWNLILAVFLGGLFVQATGCNSAPAFPKEFEMVARGVTASLTDQALWDNLAARVDGQVIEPGGEVWGGMLYVAGAKLRGVSGQVGIGGTGRGTGQQSPAAQQTIRDLLEREGVPERVIERVLPALFAPQVEPVP